MFDSITVDENIKINIIRKRVKNIYLSVTRAGSVSLTAPLKTANKVLEQFVCSKLEWIRKHQIKQVHHVTQTARQYSAGEIHFFKGIPYTLNINQQISNVEPVQLTADQNLILNLGHVSAITTKYILNKWYREQFNIVVEPLLVKWQSLIGVTISGLQIKTMKTRWGSCHTAARQISLNLELIKVPEICLEYVVVHELVHILEASHNHRFKALMSQFLPDWQIYKKALNNFVLNTDIGML